MDQKVNLADLDSALRASDNSTHGRPAAGKIQKGKLTRYYDVGSGHKQADKRRINDYG